MVNCEKDLKTLIREFEGNVSLYVVDDYNNEIRMNENRIVETASCIKTFILIEYYNQILKKEKTRNDILIYDNKKDYVEDGSGIIQYLGNLTLTSKNMAILMMIVRITLRPTK